MDMFQHDDVTTTIQNEVHIYLALQLNIISLVLCSKGAEFSEMKRSQSLTSDSDGMVQTKL